MGFFLFLIICGLLWWLVVGGGDVIVDWKVYIGYEVGIRVGQEGDYGSNFYWVGIVVEWNVFGEFGQLFFVFCYIGGYVGEGKVGVDGVYVYVFVVEIQGYGVGEVDDGIFGGVVGCQILVSVQF